MEQTPRVPLTMTILPTQTPTNSPIQNFNHVPIKPMVGTVPIPNFNHVPVKSTITPVIPNFNHVPIQPTIVEKNIPINEDKLARRAEQNREHQRKYMAKLRPFQQLANIDNKEERIAALIALSYPELSHLPKYILHQEVDLFVRTLKSKQS